MMDLELICIQAAKAADATAFEAAHQSASLSTAECEELIELRRESGH